MLSIVITLYNEEDNVSPLIRQIHEALHTYRYEIIMVDDGSTDETVSRIRALNDPRVHLIVFNRNYGQTAAMAAGIDFARGRYVVTMDGDMQNDPTDIPHMLDTLQKGNWDVVAGYRLHRQDSLVKKIPSKLANRLIRSISGISIRDYGCTLKVFRSNAAKDLELYGELHRFIPILATLRGSRITEVPVKHHQRKFGATKYGLGRTLKVMSDLLLMVFYQKFFKRPIHLFGPLGIISFGIGSILCLYLLAEKIMGNDIWGRPIIILAITLLLAGIQFITFGLIAELIMRIYYKSQQKKTYVVKDIYEATPEEESVSSGL